VLGIRPRHIIVITATAAVGSGFLVFIFSPRAILWHAEWDQSRGRWNAALERIAPLIRTERYATRANRIAARSLSHLGRIVESETCFARAGSLNVDDLRLRANGLVQLGRDFEAATTFDTILHDRPDDPDAVQKLASLRFRRGETNEAIALAERLTSLPGQAATGYALLATMHQVRGNLRDAVACFEKVVELNPTVSGLPVTAEMVYRDLAANMIDIGEPARAIPYAEHALTLNRDASGQCLLARIYLHAMRHSEAHDAWQEALRIDPNCQEALLGLGKLALEQGEPNRAASYLGRVVQLSPDDHAARYMLAQAFSRLQQTGAAQVEFQRAKELREEEERRFLDNRRTNRAADSPRAQYSRALDDLRQGHHASAIGRLRTISRAHPDFVEASRLLRHLELQSSPPIPGAQRP